MRWQRLASLLALVVVIGAACGDDGEPGKSAATGPQQQVTLDFWVAEEGKDEYFDALIKAFEAKYPNIHIKVTAFPEDNYPTKIETAMAAGNPPDLAAISNLRWLREGKVLPLDDLVREQGIDLSTYNKSIIGDPAHVNGEFGCSYQGKLYCLGSYLGAVGVFYNRAMFDAAGIPHPAPWPPMTIDQFVDTACRLTDKGKGVWGGAYGYPTSVLPWETQFSKDGRTAVGVANGPTAVHAYDVMARGIRERCAPSLSAMDPWEQGADFFAQGKLAMVLTDLQSFKKIEKAGIDYGVTHPPTAPGVEPFLQTWTDVFGVFAGTKHPDQAKLFVAFQTTQGQRLRVQVTGDMPISTAVAKEVNWAGGIRGREEALQVVPHARPAVFIPNRWDTVGALDEAYDQIVGGKPAQQVLDEAAPKVQSDLEKAWKDWDKN
jgi:ABC-type glycerol-3-phosphate transport system substrate-binding protein